ncbi:MAG: nickel-responsive transcriptional regulator NikR [Geminicoccaceae bacterium]
MQRVTISLDDDVAAALDALALRRGYANRSAAVREAASREAATGPGQSCLGVLSYVFDHERRDLSRRLTHAHHAHHVLNLSTLHLHLDHATCLEVSVLRGSAGEIRDLAARVSAERGVRLGELRLIAEGETEVSE